MIRVVTAFMIVGCAITISRAQGVVDQKAADCSAQADAKGLQGEERFAFRAKCKASGSAGTATPITKTPAAPKRTAAPASPGYQGRAQNKTKQIALADPKAEALQFLMSLMPNVAWGQEGLMISGDQNDVLVAYGNLEVTVNHYFPFGAGPEQLFVGTGGLMGTGVRIYSGSYDQNKAEWDKVIIALRRLGVRAATPSAGDRDIRSIQ